jgi:hypothetical protein
MEYPGGAAGEDKKKRVTWKRAERTSWRPACCAPLAMGGGGMADLIWIWSEMAEYAIHCR